MPPAADLRLVATPTRSKRVALTHVLVSDPRHFKGDGAVRSQIVGATVVTGVVERDAEHLFDDLLRAALVRSFLVHRFM